MQKTVNNFYEKTIKILINAKKKFINAVSRFKYTVYVMRREQNLLTYKQILSMQRNKFDYCNI